MRCDISRRGSHARHGVCVCVCRELHDNTCFAPRAAHPWGDDQKEGGRQKNTGGKFCGTTKKMGGAKVGYTSPPTSAHLQQGITRVLFALRFRRWTHTSDDSYICQLSLVLATATAATAVSSCHSDGKAKSTGRAGKQKTGLGTCSPDPCLALCRIRARHDNRTLLAWCAPRRRE